jgi:hypothetical protein
VFSHIAFLLFFSSCSEVARSGLPGIKPEGTSAGQLFVYQCPAPVYLAAMVISLARLLRLLIDSAFLQSQRKIGALLLVLPVCHCQTWGKPATAKMDANVSSLSFLLTSILLSNTITGQPACIKGEFSLLELVNGD